MTSYDLLTVFFTDEYTGFSAGGFGATDSIYKTSDGGSVWTAIATPMHNYIFSMYFTSHDTGYIAGWGFIFQTIDGGSTWNVMNHLAGQYNAMDFPDSETGYFCGIGGAIIKYSLGGSANMPDQITLPSEISIYPNPANASLFIQLPVNI